MKAHSQIWQPDLLAEALNSSPCGPLHRDCLSVLMTQQPASLRVEDLRDSKIQATFFMT